MEEKTLRKLEYEQIIKMLAERCSSGLGKELTGKIEPSLDLEKLENGWRKPQRPRSYCVLIRIFP